MMRAQLLQHPRQSDIMTERMPSADGHDLRVNGSMTLPQLQGGQWQHKRTPKARIEGDSYRKVRHPASRERVENA